MDNAKIGKFISAQRKGLSMTQKELADKLNITNKAVSKWETGEGCPDISILPALAQVLNITVDELLQGQKTTEAAPRCEPPNLQSTERAQYILSMSIHQFTNRYLIAICLLVVGIVLSFLGLNFYTGMLTTQMLYPFLIAAASMAVCMCYYTMICRNLKRDIGAYNNLGSQKIDYRKIVGKRHRLFTALFMILVTFSFIFVPLYPFRNIGYYEVFGKLIGPCSIEGWNPSILSPSFMAIDYYFFCALCAISYPVFTGIALLIVSKKY